MRRADAVMGRVKKEHSADERSELVLMTLKRR